MTNQPETIAIDEEIGACDPNLYPVGATTQGVDGLAALGEADLARFHREGFLVVHNAFRGAAIHDAIEGVLDLIDGRSPAFRNVQYEGKARATIHTLAREVKQDGVRKLMHFVEHEPRLAALAEDAALLAVITRLMGDAPTLFQDQALLKPPLIGREKPWHQDNAYFNLPPETTVVGAWIALDEAKPENGCMFVIPGSHRAGPVVHFKRRDWQICDSDVATEQVVAVPLLPGGCLLFHGLLHHGTPPSRSAQRRRALQFHYRPASVGPIEPAQRMAVFGSEGKDVTC